jgi:AraC-like DNA-binding protein
LNDKLENMSFYSSIRNCLEYINENKGNISQVKLNYYLLKCLLLLSENKQKRKTESPVSQVDKAIRYIEYNYMNGLSVSDVCVFLSIDRTYFYRIFKKYTGMAPEQYIINYKIKKAIELIRQSDLSILEISNSVGISDQYYFSKIFKK